MSTRTYEQAQRIAARIDELANDGYCCRQIVKITGYTRDIVRRALEGSGVFSKRDDEYLEGLPTINDQAAAEIHKGFWPSDEDRCTREIYEAAEAIRKRRPRYPVGYAYEPLIGIPLVRVG